MGLKEGVLNFIFMFLSMGKDHIRKEDRDRRVMMRDELRDAFIKTFGFEPEIVDTDYAQRFIHIEREEYKDCLDYYDVYLPDDLFDKLCALHDSFYRAFGLKLSGIKPSFVFEVKRGKKEDIPEWRLINDHGNPVLVKTDSKFTYRVEFYRI